MADNRAAAARPRSFGRAPLKEVQFACNSDHVPLYLQKVKSAISHEERVVAERLGLGRNDGAPPGHRLLTEDEKREMVVGLQKRKTDLDSKHSKLPLNASTDGQKQRARDLEKALKEVELDIVKFAQPRILVKL